MEKKKNYMTLATVTDLSVWRSATSVSRLWFLPGGSTRTASKHHTDRAFLLTHLYLASHKRDISKQYGPISEVAERGVWSG